VRLVDPAAEGTTYPDVNFEVTAERVTAFRQVFGGSRGVPPTFLAAAESSVYPTIVNDPRLGLDFSRVVHGSQEYEHVRPVREGERLTVRARIDGVRVRAGTGFLTIAIALLDAEGEPVAVSRSTMIERGET
jgi:hypothetical protein